MQNETSRNTSGKPRKLSEPQAWLINKMQAGALLKHHIDTGLFRLKDGTVTRSIHPATIKSLLDAGLIIKRATGACELNEAPVTQHCGNHHAKYTRSDQNQT